MRIVKYLDRLPEDAKNFFQKRFMVTKEQVKPVSVRVLDPASVQGELGEMISRTLFQAYISIHKIGGGRITLTKLYKLQKLD